MPTPEPQPPGAPPGPPPPPAPVPPPAQAAADWAQVKALFEALADLDGPARASHLAAHPAPAPVLAEVQALLAAHDRAPTAGGFLQGWAADTTTPRPVAQPGDRLGAWEVVATLGEGGMGQVFEARRADGRFEGRAAVKLLKRGMDGAAVLRRFALERNALARLNHPHIARLLDAGATPEGLPYFVMELVQGRPIDQAAAALPLEQRLGLFLQLADAVAHAHRHLLVHRDLKPGNVLVDGDGQVKLLDFGIAKALDPLEAGGQPAGAEAADATVAGARPFTPQYASPEQVRGEPVGTATDIYSLGVLLYRLLTGVRPYGRDASTPAEAARSVLEETPTRPSALSPGLAADPQWVATRRRLVGDLDNILLKALDKRPEQRYASVDALAADLRAHLAGLPVSARAPTPGYLLGKFVRRHRAVVLAASLALAGVLGGAALATWQAVVAQQQRDLAERRFDEVRRFARTMLFEVDTALRDGPTAGREKLVDTALQYLDRLSAERLTDADLLRDVAEAYERVGDIQGNTMQANLGRPDDARRSFDKALALREALARLAPDDLKNVAGLFTVHERQGDQRRAAGDLAAAAHHYGQAERHASTLAQARPDDLKAQLRRIEAARYRASVDYWPFHPSLGRHDAARARIDTLVAEYNALLARHPQSSDVLEHGGGLLNQLSDFQRIAGQYPAALATLRRSHALAERLAAQAPDNPRWQRWLYLAEGRLADALIDTGATAEGLALWQRSIDRREAGARADPANERAQRNLANGLGPLAEQLHALGRHGPALVWYQRENQLLRTLRERHPQVKALVGRLDESDRDLARAHLLVGQTAAAVAVQRGLDARRGAAAQALPTDAEAAKFALVRAQVWLGVPPAQRPAGLAKAVTAQAEAGLKVLRTAALAEPANAWLAREAALAAATLGDSLRRQAPERAATLRAEAAAALRALARDGRLPATVVVPAP